MVVTRGDGLRGRAGQGQDWIRGEGLAHKLCVDRARTGEGLPTYTYMYLHVHT